MYRNKESKIRKNKMAAKRHFMSFCNDPSRKWKFHLSSMHETYINSDKLNAYEKYMPSFIVDMASDKLDVPLIYCEVKTCKEDGSIKVPVLEFDTHKQVSEWREVFYAFFRKNNDNGDNSRFSIKIVPILDCEPQFNKIENNFIVNVNDLPGNWLDA